MKKKSGDRLSFERYLGCFGEFKIEDQICMTLCALRLRCSIERDQTVRLEILEDLVLTDGMYVKIQ